MILVRPGYFWRVKIKHIMKRILLLLLMLSPVATIASENALYRITYDCETLRFTDSSDSGIWRWNLDIGRQTAAFYNPDYRDKEKAIDEVNKSGNVQETLALLKTIGSDKYPNTDATTILVNSPHPGKYTHVGRTHTDMLVYEADIPAIEWSFPDGEEKEICGCTCLKAEGSCHGRTWTVWYTIEIPIPYGPYVLGGLPGLILEAADSEGIFHFTAVGIENAPEGTEIAISSLSKAIRTTRDKYLELRDSATGQTYGELLTRMGFDPSKMKVYDSNGKDISGQKPRKMNYLDKE